MAILSSLLNKNVYGAVAGAAKKGISNIYNPSSFNEGLGVVSDLYNNRKSSQASGGAPGSATWQPDGNGGVSYFRDGQPISNLEYYSITGEDTKAIEAQARAAYDQTQGADVSSFEGDLGGTASPAGTSGSGGGAPAKAVTATYGGNAYNLNSPEQRLSYYAAVQSNLASQRDKAVSDLKEAYSSGRKTSLESYQKSLSQIDQSLADLEAKAQDYATQFQGTLQGFQEGKRTGDVGRQNFFAQASPNAFQSSQASSQGYADQKYDQGLEDLRGQADATVGSGYLADPSQGANAFSEGSQFGRNRAGIASQRTGLESNYGQFVGQQQQGLQQGLAGISDQYNQGLSSQADQLGSIDLSQGLNAFRYGTQQYQPVNAKQADLSAYSPYTSFSQLSGGNAYQQPVRPTTQYSQQGYVDYLGRTPKASPQKDAAKDYLVGKLYS